MVEDVKLTIINHLRLLEQPTSEVGPIDSPLFVCSFVRYVTKPKKLKKNFLAQI